ncbi:MAG: alpha/beta fold hydrolase, partial [Anaerolineales bacterium]
LLLFGLVSLVVMLVPAFGLYIPYRAAYNFLHPLRTTLTRSPADVGIAHYEDAQFVTSDGLTLKGWYVPPRNGAVVIFIHGQGADRAELLDEAGFITARGYGALLFDQRGCGQSQGNVVTLGYKERLDVREAVAFIRSRAGADAPLALFGHSMGAGTALMAAAEIPEIRAVIAESAFTTLEDNVNDSMGILIGLPPFPFAPLVIFFGQQQTGLDIRAVRPLDEIGQISPRAVLLIHGAKDSVVLVKNSYALYAAAKEPKQLYILPEAGHGGFLQAEPQDYPAAILRFLADYLK